MNEEKKSMTDREISILGAKVAGKIAKELITKTDAMKVLEIAKTLLSMRLQD